MYDTVSTPYSLNQQYSLFFVFTGIILRNSLQDLLASTPWAYADDGYHQEAGTQASTNLFSCLLEAGPCKILELSSRQGTVIRWRWGLVYRFLLLSSNLILLLCLDGHRWDISYL
jgi:hypothetical protein